MSNLIKGKTGDWEVVIGLEVHAQVSSQSKLFSGAPTRFGGIPNAQVSLVDAAMPGMLPVINAQCVRQAVRTGLALNAKINLYSEFARKNYFYPDLPQGYQISQYEYPIVGEGSVIIETEQGRKTIEIERLHLEQDAGKSVHDQHPTKTLIDLNRSGVALMEIVSKPDMRSADEAAAFFNKIRAIVRWIGACDGIMAQGSMRADVNVSLHRPNTELGTRAEIKNVNSIRFLRQAVEYEILRQMEILENDGTIAQETRLFDPATSQTRSMRSKEDAHDYRYFPDPDLPPLEFDEAYVDEMRKSLPELPDARQDRFLQDYGLSAYDAAQLVADIDTADYFEQTAKACNAKHAANWVISELSGRLNQAGQTLADNRITPDDLAQLINLINDGTISGKMAKDVFDDMFEHGEKPNDIVDKKGLKQISDTDVLGEMVAKLVADNPSQRDAYRGGKTGLRGWFVGQIMKQTKGSANPKMVNQLLNEHLEG